MDSIVIPGVQGNTGSLGVNYLINVQDCFVSYAPKKPGDKRIIVLNGIDLNVRHREILTVVGPSGCGKSTLLYMLLGSKFPTSGLVLVDGQPVIRVTRDCGMVYQGYALYPHLTVLQNVMLGPILEHTSILERFCGGLITAAAQQLHRDAPKFFNYGRVFSETREKAMELIAQCGLDPARDADKYPKELSGGMRQRVAIAQAVIMDPKILLMDEAFSGLDQSTREGMQDFIYELWLRHELTIFFVTHELEEACKLGTRLIALSQYWKEKDGAAGTGAKILIDTKVEGGTEKPSHFANTSEFKQLVEEISHTALKPGNAEIYNPSRLRHEDAVRPIAA